MNSEFLQLAVMLGFFLVVAVAWLFIIYIPARTMETPWNDENADSSVESDPKL